MLWLVAVMLAMAQPVKGPPAGEGWAGQLRVQPVARTPEASTVILRLAVPREGQVLSDGRVWLQFRIDGFALGAGTRAERQLEVANNPKGQTIHIVIDDLPHFSVNEVAVDPFDRSTYFYDSSYRFAIPVPLREGVHTIRMFPARSYGESLKGDQTFVSSYFYVGSEKGDMQEWLRKPYLTYNEPSDQIRYTEEQPILLDFYLSNCELTPDGFKVLLNIDNQGQRTLPTWQPYYIFGLQKGKHTIQLQLVDRSGKLVPGPFNDVTRTIRVE